MGIMKLTNVKIGVEVTIKEISNDEIFLKLMEMGIIPGEKIVIEKIAPLGDPISVKVAGYHLSLRINEADKVIVEL
jgi:ferrous iron transport protein A